MHFEKKFHLSTTLEYFFYSTLSFRKHILQKNNKVYSMIGIIKRNFIHMGAKIFYYIKLDLFDGIQWRPKATLATQNASQKYLGDKNKEVKGGQICLFSKGNKCIKPIKQ